MSMEWKHVDSSSPKKVKDAKLSRESFGISSFVVVVAAAADLGFYDALNIPGH